MSGQVKREPIVRNPGRLFWEVLFVLAVVATIASFYGMLGAGPTP